MARAAPAALGEPVTRIYVRINRALRVRSSECVLPGTNGIRETPRLDQAGFQAAVLTFRTGRTALRTWTRSFPLIVVLSMNIHASCFEQ